MSPFPRPRSACRRLFVASALVLASAVTAAGQPTIDGRLFAGLQWRNIGPFRGGRVSAVSGAIGQPGVFYAGFPAAGVWKTTSAGATWFPVFDGIKEVSSVGAVEVAPSNPNIVWAGTGDMITNGVPSLGKGVYKSVDAGATWQSMGLERTLHIPSMLIDPRDPNVVLVAALGDANAKSDQRGIFRTTDGGRSWTRALFVDDETGAQKLARANDVPNVVFATTVRYYVDASYSRSALRSWQFGLETRDSTRAGTVLFKSLDGGATWQEVHGAGLPRLKGRTGLAVAMGTNAQRVFLVGNDGLFRSDDGGATWRAMAADDTRIRNGGEGYECGVYVDPKDPDVVYTISTSSYKSTDGGRTFTGFKGAPGGDDPQQLWIDPTNGQRMLMGLDQGAIVSFDGGGTWSSWFNQSTEQLYHIATDNSTPYWVYGTQQDAGAIRARSRGNYGAVTIYDWNAVNGWEWGTILPDPKDPNTVFASGLGIVKIRYPSEQYINVSPAIDPAAKVRTTTDLPIAWAPWNDRMLIAGFNYLTATTDGGAHWRRLSPELGIPKGLDSAAAANASGGRGAIESLAASSVGRGVIWVGTTNGLIQLTRDEGKTWTDVSIAELPNPRRANVVALEASPHVAGTAYAAVEYMRLGLHAPFFYRTRDFGKTWTRITNGLPMDHPAGSVARVIRADSVRRGLLFAGTEHGVHISFDDGDHWQPLQLNLPTTPVRDLRIKGHDLVAGTHGRGMWILDDISALRQVQAGMVAAPVHLFTPGEALRIRRNVGWNTPLPPEVPHGLNPPPGAIIDYWLDAPATGRVTLEVLDAAGSVVRHYASDPIPPVAEAAKPPHPSFWLGSPTVLSTAAGATRVNWDLLADAPPAFTHSFEINANPGLTPASPEGLLVAPGRYTLRLTVGGMTKSATVAVSPDPRSQVTVAELRAQEALLRSVSTGARLAYEGAQRVASLRTAANRAAGATPPADLAQALASLGRALDSLDRDDVMRPMGGTVRAVPSFRALNATFVGQLTAQEHADHAPTEAMRAAYTSSCAELGAALKAWLGVETTRLAGLNAVLAKLGRPPLSSPAVPATPPRC